MKAYKFLISALAIACLCVFTGCSDDEDEATVSVTTVKTNASLLAFGSDGGSQTLSVTCAGEWYLTYSSSWMSVSATSGEGNDVLTVTAEANTGDDLRSTDITISNMDGTSYVSVSVSQVGLVGTTKISLGKTVVDFEIEGGSETVSVSSDGDWTATAIEDWITVSPTSGMGDASISVSVSSNYEKPRASMVVLTSETGISATLNVSQDGDDYTDAREYPVDDVLGLADGEVLSMPKVYVCAATTDGYIVSDHFISFIKVSDTEIPAVGTEVSVLGRKTTNSNGLPEVAAKEVETASTGNVISYPNPTPIYYGNVDSYSSDAWDYVGVSGMLNGTTIKTQASANKTVSVLGTVDGLSDYDATKVHLYGFFAGAASSEVMVIGTSVEDGGSLDIYADDFEWLAPWTESSGAGDQVSTGNSSDSYPNLYSQDSLENEFILRGYTLSCSGSDCFYLFTNYLFFGGNNSQGALTLPSLENHMDGERDIELDFQWCPRRGSTYVWDTVAVSIYVGEDNIATFNHDYENGQYSVDSTGALKWIDVSLTIEKYTPDAAHRISFVTSPYGKNRSATNQDAYYRWFLDNIAIKEAY